MRHFNDEEGEEEVHPVRADGLIKLPGQHHLLGWQLPADALAFLSDVDAVLDVDEYDAGGGQAASKP